MKLRAVSRGLLSTALAVAISTGSGALLVGCGTQQTDAASHAVASVGRDRTVSVESTVDPTAYSKTERVSPVACYAEGPTWENFSKSATLVATGEIVNVEYTTIGTEAVSKADVKIQDVIAGDGQPGDTVSVFMNCGYIPLKDTDYEGTAEERENTVVEYVPEETELPELGEFSMFFLMPLDSSYYKKEWEGGFTCTHATCRLKSDDGGETFKTDSLLEEEVSAVTLEEATAGIDVEAVEKNAQDAAEGLDL